MQNFSKYGLAVPRLLLPGTQIDPARWAVIACDQHTSEPEYWAQVERDVGDSPSTLRLIYPECYLNQGLPDIPAMHRCMIQYKEQFLTRGVEGFVLVERQTTQGIRLGLVAAIDLEMYDYTPGSKPLIRSTEGTVLERLPPRMDIRRGAPLELSHVMLLANDPDHTLIKPLYQRRETLEKLYDFDLMADGGHIRGWAVTDSQSMAALAQALEALYQDSEGFLFAVGDGNHSLAAARACWLELRQGMSPAQMEGHPARYAMVEIVNLYDPALVFEPIHRAVFGADSGALTHDFILYCRSQGMSVVPCKPERAQLYLLDEPMRIENALTPLPVAILQPFLDQWLAENPRARLDYIHGLDTLNALSAMRIRLTPMDKRDLFPAVRQSGALPRKTFSMGEAQDKRYYLECRAIL